MRPTQATITQLQQQLKQQRQQQQQDDNTVLPAIDLSFLDEGLQNPQPAPAIDLSFSDEGLQDPQPAPAIDLSFLDEALQDPQPAPAVDLSFLDEGLQDPQPAPAKEQKEALALSCSRQAEVKSAPSESAAIARPAPVFSAAMSTGGRRHSAYDYCAMHCMPYPVRATN